VLRALEVAAIAGIPPSRLKRRWAEGGGKFRVLFLAISVDRDEMYRRIDARVEDMIRMGFIDEVRRLLSKGYSPDLKPMKSLGYRHVVSHLDRGEPLFEAVDRMKRDTRRYAKRQLTWLCREPEAVWTGPGNAGEAAVEMARKFLF
jgi:tRNA dimethylallyltransferase